MQNPKWLPYKAVHPGPHHTVVGNVKLAHAVYSPQLRNYRDIIVYLPPSYDTAPHTHYPVLYMHDGQNLMDQATSFSGEWYVDEILEWLGREEGLETIVVAIPNTGAERIHEYSPFRDQHHGGGKGNKYLAFITNTLKPVIDRDFRTKTERRHTGIIGSSMGALISLYAFFHKPNVFGFVGAMSPSLWFAQASILTYAESVPYRMGKIYLDAGTREHGDGHMDDLTPRHLSRRYYGHVRRLKRILVRKGYRPTQSLLHIEEKWGHHHEPAWSRRFPLAIRFFLQDGY